MIQLIVFVIVLMANFTTSPWKSYGEGSAQYFFSAVSNAPVIEGSSAPRLSFPTGDAWRIKALGGTALGGRSWDVAELQFWTPEGALGAQRPVAISSGSVSDAAYGSVSGYEGDKAFDQNSASIWGGRPDEDGELWIGLQYVEPVQVTSVRMMQGTTPISSHVATHVALEVRRDGVWERLEEVALVAKGGVFEDAFFCHDADDELAERLHWTADLKDTQLPQTQNCSDPVCSSQYRSGWSSDQIVPDTGHASLFIPISFVDELEVFRICRPLRFDFAPHQCITDDDCRMTTGDAMSVCGGDGNCLVRDWCPLPGRSAKRDLSDTLSEIQYEVVARLKPHGESKIYSNYKSPSEGQEEVCISCRFDPETQLDLLEGKPKDLASSGVELEHTFHWRCPPSEKERYGCNIWTEQSVTRDQFSLSSATAPVSRGDKGEMLRRRVTFYGVNILFRGEGHGKRYTAYPILNCICQLFGMLALAGFLGTNISFIFPGGHRRRVVAEEPYAESLHASLRKVVQLKKAAHVDLQGLTDHRLHLRVKEDVEILCGSDFNDPQNEAKVSACINALMKTKGSPTEAAKELGKTDPETLRSLAEALRIGARVPALDIDSASDGQCTESTHESV